MRNFSSIAKPHRDIIEGRLEIDIFAADLWDVYKGRGPDEYKDGETFFRRTFFTKGLKELLNMAERRLGGRGGDPIIQLQTPFGGGKTHSLIALYHKAKEWGAKRFVFVGDKVGVSEGDLTPWEEMERQLEGKVEKFKGRIPPGGERLGEILEKHQPIIILLDELQAYTVLASGVKIERTTLADQILVFLHQLTGTISKLERGIMFVSLPSTAPTQSEESEKLLQKIREILGRMEKVYAPVEEGEIAEVIRKRLFSSIDEKLAREEIENFLDYAEGEAIFPQGMDKSAYRQRFLQSYPFQPEVIDVLYRRWGSYPTFQRTRGVLRLLALVVASTIKGSQKPFISLSDFDLSDEEIRGELVKHINSQYDSVLSEDITGENSGAKRVDESLGASYRTYRFGTRVATTIFMYSFPPGKERGASLNEVKIACALPGVPSSIVVEAVEKLRQNLFYLSDEGLFFTNQPNLIRMHLLMKGRIEERELAEEEERLLRFFLRGDELRNFLFPKSSQDIPDNKEPKLVVLRDKGRAGELWENWGTRPRIYRNTLFFLCPEEGARIGFEDFLRGLIAWRKIKSDDKLGLTPSQKREVEERTRRAEEQRYEGLRRLYRILLIPKKDGLGEIDLGISLTGRENLTGEIYERLKEEGNFRENITPQFLLEKYLGENDYISVKDLLESFYRTPGGITISSENVLREAIKEGVRQKLFGLGKLEEGKPLCQEFGGECSPSLAEGEVLIRADLCKFPPPLPPTNYDQRIEQATCVRELDQIKEEIYSDQTLVDGEKNRLLRKVDYKRAILEEDVEKLKNLREVIRDAPLLTYDDKEKLIQDIERRMKEPPFPSPIINSIYLKLRVPLGKISDVMRILNLFINKYEEVKMEIEMEAKGGEGLSKSYYEDKVSEGLKQLRQVGVELLKEEIH